MPSFVTEQKVITSPNDDLSINGVLEEQNSLGWIAVLIIVLDASNVMILLTKTDQAV